MAFVSKIKKMMRTQAWKRCMFYKSQEGEKSLQGSSCEGITAFDLNLEIYRNLDGRGWKHGGGGRGLLTPTIVLNSAQCFLSQEKGLYTYTNKFSMEF